jgi:predicted ArsR family transcriptional regulator
MADSDFEGQAGPLAALGDPLRRALYAFVVKQPAAVSRDQVANGAKVARHTVKFHLDKLEEQGLLTADYQRPPGRRGPGAGRPAKVYRRSDRDFTISLPPRRYDLAAQVMAHALSAQGQDGRSPQQALRDAARSFGRSLADLVTSRLTGRASKSKTVAQLTEVLAEHGYEPAPSPEGIILRNCPFHALAQDYTSMVCGMNEQLLSGTVEALDVGLEARLEPTPKRCCVVLRARSTGEPS